MAGNVNGHVPIFSGDERNVFGLRPYLTGQTVTPPPAAAFADLASFKAQAIAALATDFWARSAIRGRLPRPAADGAAPRGVP